VIAGGLYSIQHTYLWNMFLPESRCSRHLDMIVWHFCLVLGWAIRVCVHVCVRKIHTNAPATVLLSHSTVCHLRFGRCQSGPEAFRPRTIWAWAPQHIHMYIYIYIYIYMWIYLIAFMRCFLVDGAAQPVDKGTLSSCLFLIHEHLPERVIEREKEMENSCGALRGATLTM